MLSDIVLSVFILSVAMLNVIVLSVVKLNVVMLSTVVPYSFLIFGMSLITIVKIIIGNKDQSLNVKYFRVEHSTRIFMLRRSHYKTFLINLKS